MDAALATRWLRCRRPAARPDLRLVCLPYAGGGASAFHAWPDLLPPGVEVRAAQLPARQDRLAEPGITQVSAIVDALVQALDALPPAPLALYGHSFGSLVAYELARARAAAGDPPVHLVVAARGAPHRPLRLAQPLSGLPARALAEALHLRYGAPLALLRDPDLQELTLPALRADFAALEGYRHADGPPLPCPVTALAGTQDRTLSPADVAAWGERTAGSFVERWLDAGHFFLDTHRAWTAEQVAAALPSQAAP